MAEPPPGWEPILDRNRIERQIYALEDLAAVWNNWVDRGMRARHPRLFDAIQHGANAWTAVELGINGYHFMTMAHEAMSHDLSRAFSMLAAGKPVAAARIAGGAPLAPISTYFAGRRAVAQYLDPAFKSIATDLMRDADVRVLGRAHAPDTMFTNRKSFVNFNSAESWRAQFFKAIKDIGQDFKDALGWKGPVGAAVNNAARALQTVSAPLFDHYIPMLKAGAVLKNVNDFLLANPHLDLQNRNGADYKLAVDQVRKIANTVDNRLGEMISDHLFMNKTLQQSAQVGMRSFS
jgi:hypothetical protein